MCEYAKDCLLISALDNQELIKCEGFTEFKNIAAPSEPNDYKNSIQLMPNFNKETYPFFFVTGASEVWIGNLKLCKMQSLIKGSSHPHYGDTGVSFLEQREDSIDKKATRFVFESVKQNSRSYMEY